MDKTYKLDIEEINTIEKFEMLKTEWNSIVKSNHSYSVCSTFEFMMLWWKLFENPNNKLCILVVKKDQEIIGIAPFMVVREKFLFLPTTKIEFISMAKYADSPASFTASLDILIKDHHEEVIHNIISYLHHNVNGWHFIRLNPIPANSITLTLLEKTAKIYSYKSINNTVFSAFIIRLPESWEIYFKSLSRNFRKYLSTNERKLHELGTIEYMLVTSYNDILQMFPNVMKIEMNSWKWDTGVSINSTAYNDFYKRFIEVGSKNGWLQLWLLQLNDKYIAYDYNLSYKHSLITLKGAIDDEYRDYSPGQLLLAQEIKHCFNDGIREINMLWGHTIAKERWNPSSDPYNEIFIFKNSLYAKILYCLFFPLSLYRIRRKYNDLKNRLFRKLKIRLISSEYTRVDQVGNNINY